MQNFYARFLCLKIFTRAVLQFSNVKILMNSIVIMILRKFSKMDLVMKDPFRSSTNSHHYPKYRRSRMLVHNVIRPGVHYCALCPGSADLKMKFTTYSLPTTRLTAQLNKQVSFIITIEQNFDIRKLEYSGSKNFQAQEPDIKIMHRFSSLFIYRQE